MADDQTLYVNEAELKEQLTMQNTQFADSEVTDAVQAASRGVDALCRRRFWLDPSPVTRKYTPEPGGLLEIDDLADDAPTVKVNGVEWTEGVDYQLRPLNAPADERPYTHIEFIRRLPAGDLRGAVSVEGTFGWPKVPPTLRAFAKVLAGRLVFRMRQAPGGFQMAGIDQATAIRIAQTDPDFAWLTKTFARSRLQSMQLG